MTPHDVSRSSRSPLDKWWEVFGGQSNGRYFFVIFVRSRFRTPFVSVPSFLL